jgi:hypothetical protein
VCGGGGINIYKEKEKYKGAAIDGLHRTHITESGRLLSYCLLQSSAFI